MIRKWLLLILVLSLLFAGGELLLVGHTEDAWQWLPLALLGMGLAVIAWHAVSGRAASVRVLRWVMILYLVSGPIGIAQHWKAKMEFKSEMNPSLSGFVLLWESLQSQSPPPLAPGAMIQMGLLGLLYAHRHPLLSAPETPAEQGD